MSEQEKVSGRTAWDLGAEFLGVLGRIGPSAILVAGFLFFAYFFYQEINKESTAQKQLVETYEKIGGMSEQLIKNIDSLIDLNAKMDKDVEENRQKLAELEHQTRGELTAAQRELEKVEAETRRALAEMQQKRQELDKELAKLEREVQEFDNKRIDI